MAFSTRVFYQVLGLFTGPSPATGFMWQSGSIGAPGSGINQLNQIQRVQAITNGWGANRQNIIQLGQAGALDRVIIDPLSSNLTTSWYVADLVNEYNLGFALNSGQGILNSFINKTQDEKNYFIAIAPQGQDFIGYTGQSQVIQITNGYIDSYSTEGGVGRIPTANITVQGYNWATLSGSINQQSQAVEVISGSVVTGLFFTIPTGVTGNVGSTSVIRPAEIQMNIANAAIGLDATNMEVQNYSISVNFNRENLLKLGSKYPYSKEIRFPVTFRVSVTAFWGNLITGSINNLFCNDAPYSLQINLFQPCSTVIAAQYTAIGIKLDSQELNNLSVSDLAGQATLTFDGVIGSSASSIGNLTFSGII